MNTAIERGTIEVTEGQSSKRFETDSGKGQERRGAGMAINDEDGVVHSIKCLHGTEPVETLLDQGRTPCLVEVRSPRPHLANKKDLMLVEQNPRIYTKGIDIMYDNQCISPSRLGQFTDRPSLQSFGGP